MEKAVIVIPTYNESGNVPGLVRAISQAVPDAYILIVDDSSPDGTAEIVKAMQADFPYLMLLLRRKKEGLGAAYKAGFSHALKEHPDATILGMMDADFCHDPKDLPRLLALAEYTDMVIGSVYAPGGRVPPSFTLARRFLSRGGNLYCRLFFREPLTDWTNAFVMIRTDAIKRISYIDLPARDFAFVFGIKYALLRAGASWKDLGVIALERTTGQSKVTWRAIREALLVPWRLCFGKYRV